MIATCNCGRARIPRGPVQIVSTWIYHVQNQTGKAWSRSVFNFSDLSTDSAEVNIRAVEITSSLRISIVCVYQMVETEKVMRSSAIAPVVYNTEHRSET
jgi:hypothetical protein